MGRDTNASNPMVASSSNSPPVVTGTNGLGSSVESSSRRRGRTLAEFARYMPLRLSPEERSLLNVLEQTLHVSEYTDRVDITVPKKGQKTRCIQEAILEIYHIAIGLTVASGQERMLTEACGQDDSVSSSRSRLFGRRRKSNKNSDSKAPSTTSTTFWANKEPKELSSFYQTLFEIGRRNKILNPGHMRATYGKLMYILQDARNPAVERALGFSMHKELQLVVPFLEEHQCLELLEDHRLEAATQVIRDRDSKTGKRFDRELVQEWILDKRGETEALIKEYTSKTTMSEEDVRRVIESIADAIASVDSNLAPVKRMILHLEDNFDPNLVNPGFSLELISSQQGSRMEQYSRYGVSAYGSSGYEGPKLTHSHATQYLFVWQSLRLWCKVMKNMHKLWISADKDLLSTSNTYSLMNTGQGLNRVQICPRVGKVMRYLLMSTQKEAGTPWVGLSVVHLGDRDVPNALVFIDKYTQIPRFLDPIVSFIQGLPELCNDRRMSGYVNEHFESQEKLKQAVLLDFFKHGFDGSGDDGGSCIDGRLTSSWNWTARISQKRYYHVFMMSGFQGFDGDFK